MTITRHDLQMFRQLERNAAVGLDLSPGDPAAAWALEHISQLEARPQTPIPMLLWCPQCGERHIDAGEFATKAHHTHACQECGHVWRPAIVATVGVKYLPGFKDA